MNNWRPEGWKNPYMPKTRDEEIQVTHKGWPKTDAVMTFEAGADAMLIKIREEIEKVELPKYKKSWTSDGEIFEDCLAPVTPEDTRQKILDLLSISSKE